MKKLIMAAAIVCAAVAANAASHNWDVGGAFYRGDLAEPTGEELAGSTIYLFQGAGTYAATQAAVLTMLGDLATTGISALDGYLGSGVVNNLGEIAFTNASDAQKIADDSGSTAYINSYLIAISADGKYATGLANAPIEVTEGVIGTGAMIPVDWAVDEPKGASEYWSTVATSVPEPTSGLMLLLGMAGLALRRRRA